jgi:carbon monoxide dehydrogenase subunit G
MITVSRTFAVPAAPAAVLDYLKDFGNAVEWDPGTQSCTRTDSGPIEVGAQWHNVSKILGVTAELTYTLEKLEPDTIVLVGRNEKSTSTDTITVRPAGDGTELTYRAELEMHGLAKLATPVMKLEFEKLAGQTEKQLTGVLTGLGKSPAL